jgi:hypothetical protein
MGNDLTGDLLPLLSPTRALKTAAASPVSPQRARTFKLEQVVGIDRADTGGTNTPGDEPLNLRPRFLTLNSGDSLDITALFEMYSKARDRLSEPARPPIYTRQMLRADADRA